MTLRALGLKDRCLRHQTVYSVYVGDALERDRLLLAPGKVCLSEGHRFGRNRGDGQSRARLDDREKLVEIRLGETVA